MHRTRMFLMEVLCLSSFSVPYYSGQNARTACRGNCGLTSEKNVVFFRFFLLQTRSIILTNSCVVAVTSAVVHRSRHIRPVMQLISTSILSLSVGQFCRAVVAILTLDHVLSLKFLTD